MVGQMDRDTVESIGDGGARGAPLLVVGPKHEMVDEQLRAPTEEVSISLLISKDSIDCRVLVSVVMPLRGTLKP